MKQLYLCNGCKKMGIKSSRSKVFEDFYCPKCKRNTTLFLPTVKIEKPKPQVEESKPIAPPDLLPAKVSNNKRNVYGVKEIIIFMIGFIAALWITKT